jgi:hypothetical protein
MVTVILKIVEMTLLKWEKIIPENNAFGDKYNITGKLFYM